MPMTLENKIRQYVMRAYIEPARIARLSKATFSSVTICAGLKLKTCILEVCEAIDAKKFQDENVILLTARTGPRRRGNVRWTFSL
jgi:hypothetical protein